MRIKRLVALALAVAAPALPVRAQEPGDEVFGEAIDVRVVNVEAVVADKRGNRVRGLTAADFRLLVDGREVPIDYSVSPPSAPSSAPSSASPSRSSPCSAPSPVWPQASWP